MSLGYLLKDYFRKVFYTIFMKNIKRYQTNTRYRVSQKKKKILNILYLYISNFSAFFLLNKAEFGLFSNKIKNKKSEKKLVWGLKLEPFR